MPTALRVLGGVVFFMLLAPAAQAVPSSVTFTHSHFLFTLSPASYPQWRTAQTQWAYRGIDAVPSFCDGECVDMPEGWSARTETTWNHDAIKETLSGAVVSRLARDAGSVTITRNGSGEILFTGRGITGRNIDADLLTRMTIKALENDVSFVRIPVEETQPALSVDEGLSALGIREVLAVGESDFTGSPVNRKHNIEVGLGKFNGTLIPQGAVFSFNETLGPVDASTGYRKELVILGTHTLPDYGGGLCQVSSTAYRGIWEYGFPIEQRRNHSYIVQYYSPQGTDATIYPPHTDMKFKNDSPGAILMQTFVDEQDRAYFVYYGTHDDRRGEIFGPYTWSTTPAPAETVVEYTTDIPPGTQRKVGSKVPGMRTSWFRLVRNGDGTEEVTETYSTYEARPLFYQIGIAAGEEPDANANAGEEAPGWLPNIE